MRFLLATACLFATAAITARAADLPTGTWAVNVDGKTGELVISDVASNGTVSAKLFGTEVSGHWDGKAFTFGNPFFEAYTGYLVSEPAGKGKTKYTLAGVRKQAPFVQMNMPPPPVLTGWYAQIATDTPAAPAGRIKAEVKGVLVCPADKPLSEAHVSVKQKNSFGQVEETRVYFYLSEGEWKGRRDEYQKLSGTAVVVTGAITLMPKGSSASIPDGALYFLRGYELKAAKESPK